jgi:hypothetical protein
MVGRAPGEDRRLLFNCDGHSVWQQAGGDIQSWITNVFTGLVDSQVDALLWCDGAGGHTASYSSQVLERTGERGAASCRRRGAAARTHSSICGSAYLNEGAPSNDPSLRP